MAELSWLTERPIAHRGLHDMNQKVWENTLASFERAMAHGYAIECDLHLTSDGGVVVFHDDQLERLTGQRGYVWQRTTGEMRALRIGGTDERVPELRDLLDLVDGKVPLVIELKGIPGHDAGMTARVGEILAGYRGPAAVMTFDHWLLRDFARDIPDLPRGLTAWGDQRHEIEAHFGMLAHGLDFTSYSFTHLPNPFVTFMREELGRPAITWTIRDEAGIEATRAHGDQMTFEGFLPEPPLLA